MLHQIDPQKHAPHGEAMAEAVSTCVHCGFCLAACPTYRELGQEADSPRGRIVLMKEVLEGTLELETAQPHLDACLGCLACEPACPSGVPYRNLISPFRALTEPKRRRTLLERLRRVLTLQTLPYPTRFRLATRTGKFAKPLAPLMPRSLAAMLDLLPSRLPQAQSWPELSPAQGPRRGRVALLIGCAQRILDPDINTATIEVLNRNGIEVVVPPNQGCCGALSWHSGSLDQARQLARHNLDAFPEDVDAVVTNAAGCGSAIHEYELIFQGTSHQERAARMAQSSVDVAAYLGQMGPLASIPDRGRTVRVAYHDACHLANAQGVRIEPRQLLLQIPGVELLEIADSHLCCGSAGTYNIDQPNIAASLGRQKAENVRALKADVVASGNIGCLTQLSNHLLKLGSDVSVQHTMQVLRDAYRG